MDNRLVEMAGIWNNLNLILIIKTKKKLVYTVLVILTLLPCIYIFQEGEWNVQKVFHLLWMKLGFLYLSIVFVKVIYNLCINCGFGVLKRMWGYMLVIFVGGGWLLELSAAIVEAIFKALMK